jgi:hypothetical protein
LKYHQQENSGTRNLSYATPAFRYNLCSQEKFRHRGIEIYSDTSSGYSEIYLLILYQFLK